MFSRTVGSPNRDGVVSIAIGPQGGPVIAGFMRGPSDLLAADAGVRSGMYVASFDSSGALAWSNFPQPSFADYDRVNAVAASPAGWSCWVSTNRSTARWIFGGGPLPAAEAGPPVAFVARLGKGGQELQVRTFGLDPSITTTHDPSVRLASAAIDGAGNVAVAASLYRSLDFGLGSIPMARDTTADYFPLFLRFDAAMNTVVSRAIGGCEYLGGNLHSAAVDGANNLIVGGSIAGNIDPSRDFGGDGLKASVVFSISP